MKAPVSCSMALAVFLVGSTTHAQPPDYVGDMMCGLCHSDTFVNYMQSGHPWKLHWVGGVEPAADEWPHTPVPPLPAALGWNDVEYVIGNFFWKARFVLSDGFIYTGTEAEPDAQWNLATEEWAAYHTGEEHPYDCGRCHTTGYDPEINPEWPPGIVGTWIQEGVRCEACHGPGGAHVDSQMFGDGRIFPTGGKDCAECHYRDAAFRMPWKSGFMRHHQQGEDISHSPHDITNPAFADHGCATCHSPHLSTVYGLGGSIAECGDCHPGDADNNFYVVEGMEAVECIDCHMPKMGKSAVASNEFTADIRSHLFSIMTDPVAAADNTYVEDETTFWNQDANGAAWITLDYACLGCHSEFDPNFTLEDAAAFADGIHNPEDEPPPPPPPPPPPVDCDFLAYFDAAVADGTLQGGGPWWIAGIKLYVMGWYLQVADSSVENGWSAQAAYALLISYFLCDGASWPIPDMVVGEAAPGLAESIMCALRSMW